MAGKELTLNDEELIVSKTDINGKIIYGNKLFINISGYKEIELLHQHHKILRHRDMPAIIFKYLWQTIKEKKEVFAYVLNKTKENNYYWVFAHVTPSFDSNNNIIGYHSVRRKPNSNALAAIKPLYKNLLEIEKRQGINASEIKLNETLKNMKVSYDEFILSF